MKIVIFYKWRHIVTSSHANSGQDKKQSDMLMWFLETLSASFDQAYD